MKVIQKQKQFSVAIKRRKIDNIKLLIDDPEVDPTINDNWALSASLGNWEIFKILKNNKKIDEYANYSNNLLSSIGGENGNKVFDYLSDHQDFKYNIRNCLESAIKNSFKIFQDIYKNQNYSDADKAKDFEDLLEIAYLYGKDQPLNFLLKQNKENKIQLNNLKFNPKMFSEVLKVIVSDSRMLGAFDINEAFKSLVMESREENLHILSRVEVDYDYKKVIDLIIIKFEEEPVYSGEEYILKIEAMILSLISGYKGFEVSKYIQDKELILLEYFEDEIKAKITENKIKEF
jgi:hypothetical protein